MKFFEVSTLTGNVTHLVTADNILLCGIWLFEPELLDEIDIEKPIWKIFVKTA